MLATSKSVRDLLESAFKKIDQDKSGFLERRELEEVLRTLTRCLGLDDPSPDDVADVMRELDRNGDERLSREEFQSLIEQVLDIIFKESKVRYELTEEVVRRDQHK